jgi:hypothetical protein
VSIQRGYWTANPAEQAALGARVLESLTWAETLRLHHLNCLEYLMEGGEGASWRRAGAVVDRDEGTESPALARCRATAHRLLTEHSPYRPRFCMVWQGEANTSGHREPDRQGWLRNASMTHLGCVETIRLDAKKKPREIAFLPLDDIRALEFVQPALFRFAKVLYDDGRDDEIVQVPLVYGVSWMTAQAPDHDATTSRHVGRLEVEGRSYVIAIGRQDFAIAPQRDGEESRIGLGSVGELMVALESNDPRFEQKCRSRGLNPNRGEPGDTPL